VCVIHTCVVRLQLIVVGCTAVTVAFLVPFYYRCVRLFSTRKVGAGVFATEAIELALVVVAIVKHRQRFVVARRTSCDNTWVAFAFTLLLIKMQDRLRLTRAVVPSLHTPRRFPFARAQILRTRFGTVACEIAGLRIFKFEVRIVFVLARMSCTWVHLAVASTIVPHDRCVRTR